MTKPTAIDRTRGNSSALAKWDRRQLSGALPWQACDVDQVRNNLIEAGVFDPTMFRFIVGDVCETLLHPDNLPDQIALLRLDTDWHESTKIELEVLYPRLVKGGVLILDDFGHWLGARRAAADYFAGDTARLKAIDYTGVVMVK